MSTPSASTIPDYLEWGSCNLGAELRATWLEALSDEFGRLVATSESNRLATLVDSMEDSALAHALLDPNTSDVLLWPERHDRAATIAYLIQTLDSLARKQAPSQDRASALLGRTIAIQWDDSWIRSLDRVEPGTSINRSDRRRTLGRLEEAHRLISQVSPSSAECVAHFTRVLVLSERSGVGFRTRSPERRIGCSLFENAHREDVDSAALAEGLIHEALHSFLDIEERLSRLRRPPEEWWIRDDRLYDGESRVTSPWTGAPLALPTFLQACFVWYGLLHFWCAATDLRCFPSARVRERIEAAARGFLAGSLVDRLEEYRDDISGRIRGALTEMQRRVSSAAGP